MQGSETLILLTNKWNVDFVNQTEMHNRKLKIKFQQDRLYSSVALLQLWNIGV